MPWVAAAGAVASAGIGAAASNNAAKKQEGAAGAAQDTNQAMYTGAVERNQPFYTAGTDALAQLQQRLPALTKAYDPTQLESTPGYQFGMLQGQQALERSLAARGRSVSGAALKAASQFGTDYSTTKLDDADSRQRADNGQAFSQLDSLANLGEAAGNNTTAAGTQFSTGTSNNDYNAANSAGAGTIAAGNQLSSLINQGVSGYKGGTGYNQYNPITGYSSNPGNDGMSTNLTGNSLPTAGGMADGGPVRVEPKIGTRSPLPTGGGGGMSRDAILAALTAAHDQAQPPAGRTGIGALPANPVTNPGAILAAQMQAGGANDNYATGGPVEGPGGPRTDSIPARLSNGEHVVDAASVTALGDGDNEKGQAILNEMRARIKAHAGIKPPAAAPMRPMTPARPVQRPSMGA